MKKFFKRFINWTILLSVIGGLIVLFLSLDQEFRIMLALLIVLVIILASLDRLSDYINKLSNKNEPILVIDARVISKSIEKISKDTDYYYLTFEVNSLERFTLRVNHDNYALVVEGDFGKLICQGSRFISFERIIN